MKILVVDDELVSRKKLDFLTRNLGHETIVAVDGQEGWEAWRQERPRLVVTDWVMPGLDGIDLCRKIREAEGSLYTYIIMVTAKEEINDMVTGMDAGADDFITKPFIKEELAVRIRVGERIIAIESRDIVIFSMAKLAESRDRETGNHLERIRFYCRALAERMTTMKDPAYRVDKQFIDNIFLTSPLHDIGKIGIADAILRKPGRFTPEEFDAMKDHCRIGYETLNGALEKYPRADYLQMSAEIALSHHERFDGAGYPLGIKGQKIPLSARIVALADTYDALIRRRVYKEGFSHDVAKNLILEARGSQFDPVVVDVFLACEDEFLKIARYFQDEA